ncbi:MAG: DUF6089 family protein [Vicingaceae bacterium]
MVRFSLVFFLLFVFTQSFSQAWKRQRLEVGGGIGTTNFLGDLGGSASEGGSYGPKDLNFAASRYVITATGRYFIRSNMAARGSLSYARIAGDDADSKNPTRNSRGLKFRSPVVELAAIYEFYFLTEKTKGMYRLKGSRGLAKLKLDGYLFAGLGLFYFNPRNEMDGKWHSLQPLGTEGQTAGNGSKYSRIQGSVPLGIGFRKKIQRQWHLGLEFGVRMTTSDYLDDVSGKYFEQDKIKGANGDKGDLAAYLANPNENNNWPSVTYNQDGTISEFQQRGDPKNNDTYMFATVTLSYKIKRRRRSLPKF